MIKRIYILLFVFACCALNMSAQEDKLVADSAQTAQIETIDSIQWRVPAVEKILEFKKDEAFDYTQNLDPREWIMRFITWLSQYIPSMNPEKVSDGLMVFLEVMKYVGIALIITLLVYVILRLCGINFRAIWGRKKTESLIEDVDMHTEDVNEMNFERLVENAIRQNNYRLAIRYSYLRNLKLLSDKGIIAWNPTKTNLRYLQEIKDNKLKTAFLRTTYIFDYVWYGEQELDKQGFDAANTELDEFQNLIGNEE